MSGCVRESEPRCFITPEEFCPEPPPRPPLTPHKPPEALTPQTLNPKPYNPCIASLLESPSLEVDFFRTDDFHLNLPVHGGQGPDLGAFRGFSWFL